MKHIFTVFSLLAIFSCQPKELPTVKVIEEGKVILKLSHQSNKAEMEAFAQQAMSQGLKIQYEGTEYFEDGKLRNLKMSVVSPNGQGGRTSGDQVTLQFKYFGFKYEKDGNPVFSIGEI